MKRKSTAPSPVELQKCLKGVDYPADKNELEEAAKSNGASEEVLECIRDLPEEQYETPAAVMKAFGESDR